MSDSEDEDRQQTSAQRNRDSKYKCPAEFVSFSYKSSANALLDGDDQQEIWLIKAPARFDPKCFEELKLPLSGVEVVQSSDASPQVYSIFSGGTAPSDLHLLMSKGKHQKPSLCSSSFSGVLKISESYGNCGENQGPVPVPAAPAPCIPDGLKQRFQPFGTQDIIQEEAAGVSPTPTKKSRQDLGEGEERKKKKKKKKDKRQDSEAVFIKQEEAHVECDQLQLFEFMEEEPTEERRRRKKKKVKKERECESRDVVDASLISKTEPLDPSYNYSETPVKHKKKKKSSRND